MQDILYREIILDHWKHPHNYGLIAYADIDITDTNPLCGDEIRITVAIKDKKISNIKFTAQGCAISTASASIFFEMVKGKSIEKIKKIAQEEFLSKLGIQVSPARLTCALLGYATLQKVLESIK